MKKYLTTLSAALLTSIAVPALAQNAEVTADLNMRAGPGTQYPVITTIPDGRAVNIYGCERGINWCDVSWRGNRGWVYSDYLDYTYRNRTRPVSDWGARIDLPLLSFTFGEYADRHYRGMPWYDDRGRWDRDDRRRRWRDDDRRGRWDDDDDGWRGGWRDDDDRRGRWDDDDDGWRSGWRDDDRRDWRDDDRRRGGWRDDDGRRNRGDNERRAGRDSDLWDRPMTDDIGDNVGNLDN